MTLVMVSSAAGVKGIASAKVCPTGELGPDMVQPVQQLNRPVSTRLMLL
jgi:hypothetical protein